MSAYIKPSEFERLSEAERRRVLREGLVSVAVYQMLSQEGKKEYDQHRARRMKYQEALRLAKEKAGPYADLVENLYPCPTILEKVKIHLVVKTDESGKIICDEFDLFYDKRGLFFVGDVGTGKTFGIWKLLLMGSDFYFGDSRTLCYSGLEFHKFLKSVAKDRPSEEDLNDWIDILNGEVVLFIDDLPQAPFDKTSMAYFFELLEAMNKKETDEVLVTSQYDVEQLFKKWSKELPWSRDLVAGVCRRIKENFKGYRLTNERKPS